MPDIAPTANVQPGARIACGAVVKHGAWIGANVVVEAGTVVEQNAVVGYGGDGEVRIGRNCLIANGATIYHSAILGDGVKVRHNSVVRDNVEIGEGTSLGTGCTVEPHTRIGRFCSFHCKVHITDFSTIGDYVFIGPGFVSLSDLALDYRRPQLHQGYRGVIIARAARIGGGVLAMPGCEIGEEAVVGAGSHISGVLKPQVVYLGTPARAVRRVPPGEEVRMPS